VPEAYVTGPSSKDVFPRETAHADFYHLMVDRDEIRPSCSSERPQHLIILVHCYHSAEYMLLEELSDWIEQSKLTSKELYSDKARVRLELYFSPCQRRCLQMILSATTRLQMWNIVR